MNSFNLCQNPPTCMRLLSDTQGINVRGRWERMMPYRQNFKKFGLLFLGGLTLVFYQNMEFVDFVERSTWNKKGAGVSLWQEQSRDRFSAPLGYHEPSALEAAKRLRELNVAWYYTWDPEPLSMVGHGQQDPLFIPMIYRHKPESSHALFKYPLTLENQIARARQHRPSQGFRYLLLFNEPDNVTHDHPFQNPLETAEATNAVVSELSSLASFVGAPAMALIRGPLHVNLTFGGKINLTSQQQELVRGKTLPWFKLFLQRSSSSLTSIMRGPNGRPLVPVHIYPDPFQLGVVRSADDLLPGSPQRLRAKRAIINQVIKFLNDVRREHDAQIMITEFNIADWAAKWEPQRVPHNRIPADFVAEVLRDLLPEISSLSYVTHYALFTNSADYGENLRTAASFTNFFEVDAATGRQRRIPASLTEVGQVYADFRDVACQKGEFTSGAQYVEFMSEPCNPPIEFGWNQADRNGWYWHSQTRQWRRHLTAQQAGVFPNHGQSFEVIIGKTTSGDDIKQKQICEHSRFVFNQRIVEYKSMACPHSPEPGWTIEAGQRRRTYNHLIERVGVIGHYLR